MANTITTTTLLDGARYLAVLVSIVGDGSGDESNTKIVDRSAFAPTSGTETVVEKINGHLSGFTARLSFDASTDLIFASLPDGNSAKYNFCGVGGLSSNASGAGSIGDVLLTTVGLGSGEHGTFLLQMRKA